MSVTVQIMQVYDVIVFTCKYKMNIHNYNIWSYITYILTTIHSRARPSLTISLQDNMDVWSYLSAELGCATSVVISVNVGLFCECGGILLVDIRQHCKTKLQPTNRTTSPAISKCFVSNTLQSCECVICDAKI